MHFLISYSLLIITENELGIHNSLMLTNYVYFEVLVFKNDINVIFRT